MRAHTPSLSTRHHNGDACGADTAVPLTVSAWVSILRLALPSREETSGPAGVSRVPHAWGTGWDMEIALVKSALSGPNREPRRQNVKLNVVRA
jgi:hypothetical protein